MEFDCRGGRQEQGGDQEMCSTLLRYYTTALVWPSPLQEPATVITATPGRARRDNPRACDIIGGDKIVYRYVLSALIEAARNRPDEQKFELVLGDQAALVSHPGLPNGELRARPRDIEILAKKGLITCFGPGAIQEFWLVEIPGN
jgi:hypothetical protein